MLHAVYIGILNIPAAKAGITYSGPIDPSFLQVERGIGRRAAAGQLARPSIAKKPHQNPLLIFPKTKKSYRGWQTAKNSPHSASSFAANQSSFTARFPAKTPRAHSSFPSKNHSSLPLPS